jgi:hypothetical protein
VVEPTLQPCDEAAAFGRKYEADLLRRVPALALGSDGVEPVDLLPLDVDEPQRFIALDPDGSLAQRCADFPDQVRFSAHVSSG